jgi:DNA-binding transcriptional LysR family regulator
MRYALALAEHGNFHRAANAVGISPPAFSRGIKELERLAGTLLFERGKGRNGRVTPTDAGQVFLIRARQMASQAADLGREMDLLRGLEIGELSVGVGPYPFAMMVTQTIGRLVCEHPAVRLRVSTETWPNLPGLLRGRVVDLAVMDISGIAEDGELSITRMQRHQGYLAVRRGHPLLARCEPLRFLDVLDFPFVGGSRVPPAMLKQMLQATSGTDTKAAEVKSIPSIACDSVFGLKSIIAGSDAVGFVPLNVVMPDVRAGVLAVLPLVEPWLQGVFAAVRLAHRSLSQLGERFVQILMEEDRQVYEFEQQAARELFSRKVGIRRRAAS